MMRRFLLGLLLLVSFVSQAQTEFYPDTTARPSKANRFRMGVVGGKAYIVPRTGNVIPLLLQTSFSAKPDFVGSVAAFRILSDASSSVRLIAKNLEGDFVYDPTDTSSPDNGATVVVTPRGRYKRVGYTEIDPMWWNAKGDGVQDDAPAIQAATNWATTANNPALFGANSPYNQHTNTVHIRHGFYKLLSTVNVSGSCTIDMEEATSYGGTRLVMFTSNQHMFRIKADTDGGSSAVHFKGGILIGGVGTTNSVALIYGGSAVGDGNNNSTHIDRTWFRSPEGYAVSIERGDDIQIKDCTFDVSGRYAVALGGASPVTNFIVSGNTFYDIPLDCVNLVNANTGQIINNRVYTNNGDYNDLFIKANTTACSNVLVSGNVLNNTKRLILFNQTATGLTITNNKVQNAMGRVVEIGGGGIPDNVTIQGNTFTGNFSQTLTISNVTYPDSPIFCYGTGLVNSIISGNTFRNTATKAGSVALLMGDNRVLANRIRDNMFINFGETYHRVHNIILNGHDYINVRDFGALGFGNSDDGPAIQSAIDYARAVIMPNGGNARLEVVLPTGAYLTFQVINLTNANGITIRGGTGRYINTSITGVTGGIIFDLTGSIMCHIEGITITADAAWGANCSKIGVQFALSQDPQSGNQVGGLNCLIRNCYIQMGNMPTANGGIGSIGLLNVRSEEFAAHDMLIKANAGMIFSNVQDISAMGNSFTVTSPFAQVHNGVGSMGVVDLTNVSIQNVERRKAAITCIGVNSFRVHGYLVKVGTTDATVTNEVAMDFYQQVDNFEYSGTIEGYSTVAKFHPNCLATNIRINTITANQAAPLSVAFDVTGATLRSVNAKVAFGNPPEFNNGRRFVYHAPISGGDLAATGSMQNCEWTCDNWVDNTLFVSANILARTANTKFNSGQAFEKRNMSVIDNKTYAKPLGVISAGNPDVVSSAIRFSLADKTTKTAGNGGVYQAIIRGTIAAGALYTSGGNVAVDFEARVLVTQNQNGTLNAQKNTTLIFNKSQTSASYLDITDITASFDFSNPAWVSVMLTVKNTGTGVGETVKFLGNVELISDFAVNQSIVFE